MTTLDRFADVAADVRAELAAITRLAHVNTFHPNAFDWSEVNTPVELAFLSEVAFGEPGHEQEAVGYLTKELAQLAEIERHVSAVMALVLGELHDHRDSINVGHELHHALSCFAAEEIQHANTFYRYARSLSGVEPRVDAALFDERLAVFQTDDHPYVKLVALCCSAYVGESVITVFEHRTDNLDPMRAHFFTRLLHTHGLDEARHVKIDHVAMHRIYPVLSTGERDRVRELVAAIEELNGKLARAFHEGLTSVLGIDFVTANPAFAVQLEMMRRFGELIFAADGTLRTVDEVLDDELHELVTGFSGLTWVHRSPSPKLTIALPASSGGTG